MEAKKSPKANLESTRGLLFELGLVVALVSALLAFNVKSYSTSEVTLFSHDPINEIDDAVPITPAEELPPPPPEKPQLIDKYIEVDDAAKIDTELEPVDFGDDADKAQTTFIPVIPEPEPEDDDDIVPFVGLEEEPSFPGGEAALYKFMADHVKYPDLARTSGITGKVYIRFVVEKDGSVTNVKVMRDIGGGCGSEAVRVVKMMPKWKPGKQRNRPVRTEFNLPISFNLK